MKGSLFSIEGGLTWVKNPLFSYIKIQCPPHFGHESYLLTSVEEDVMGCGGHSYVSAPSKVVREREMRWQRGGARTTRSWPLHEF